MYQWSGRRGKPANSSHILRTRHNHTIHATNTSASRPADRSILLPHYRMLIQAWVASSTPCYFSDSYISDDGFWSLGIVVSDSWSCAPPRPNRTYGASRNLPVGPRSASEWSYKVCALRTFHTA